MKKKLTVIAAIAIAIALLSAGTLAYFTHQTQADNVIEMGKVKMILNDKTLVDNELIDFPEEGLTDMMPGVPESKIVSVSNTADGAEIWVRVKLDCSISAAEEESPVPYALQSSQLPLRVGEGEAAFDVLSLNLNTTDWVLHEGWYYYKTSLKANQNTSELFTQVSLHKDTPNEYQSCTVIVNVIAQAVQFANNNAGVDFVSTFPSGWPAD